MGKKRSKGVSIFAWIELIFGIICIFNFSLLIILYVAGKYPAERVSYGISNNIEELILGVYFIIAGILTLKLKPKGRRIFSYSQLYLYFRYIWRLYIII